MLSDLTGEQRALAEFMSSLSEDAYCAGWMDGLEFALWQVLIGERREYGRHVMTSDDRSMLRSLSDAAAGWIVFDDEREETWLSHEDWQSRFQVWQRPALPTREGATPSPEPSDEYGPYDLLDEIDLARCDPRTVAFFILDVCERFRDQLAPVVANALTAARAHHSGFPTDITLEKSRLDCWSFLGDRACRFEDPAVCRVRAVIFTTSADNHDDPFERLHHFLDFVTRGGVPEAELLKIMQARLMERPTT